MSAHLPECLPESVPVPCPDGKPGCCVLHTEQRRVRCICDRLRACEQRILLSKPNIELSAVYGYEAGRSDGLDAARDAVDRMGRYGTDEMEPWDSAIGYALAAIDALRGES